MLSSSQALEEFRNAIREEILNENETQFCNDRCLLRYLRANKMNLKNAILGLKETLNWRRTYQPHKITADEFKSFYGATYLNGRDKLNRPIIYIKKRETENDPEKGVRLLVYTLERAIESMDEGVEQWVLLFDMEKYSSKNASPLHISRQTLNILMKHYPERMGAAFFTYYPWAFETFYSIFRRFMEKRTTDKIHFVTDFRVLLDHIDANQLECKYGGGSIDRAPNDEIPEISELSTKKIMSDEKIEKIQ